jgi:hypothetical protein
MRAIGAALGVDEKTVRKRSRAVDRIAPYDENLAPVTNWLPRYHARNFPQPRPIQQGEGCSLVKAELVPLDRIERVIVVLRGHKVILDGDLAALYGVTPKRLNEQVRRNHERFPSDFMFQLTHQESENLRSQIATSSTWGGRRYQPHAFTEQGVAMLSSVLRSPRAVQVNIEIMRAFVRLRQILQSNSELARKLAALEKKYDAQFRVVFDAIRELMSPPPPTKRRIGFGTDAK